MTRHEGLQSVPALVRNGGGGTRSCQHDSTTSRRHVATPVRAPRSQRSKGHGTPRGHTGPVACAAAGGCDSRRFSLIFFSFCWSSVPRMRSITPNCRTDATPHTGDALLSGGRTVVRASTAAAARRAMSQGSRQQRRHACTTMPDTTQAAVATARNDVHCNAHGDTAMGCTPATFTAGGRQNTSPMCGPDRPVVAAFMTRRCSSSS